AATVVGVPSGLRTPLETAGLNGSNDAAPVVSTVPPGTSENAATAYVNALGFAAFCTSPRSLASAGSSIVEPFIGTSASQASTISPVAASKMNDAYWPLKVPVVTAPTSAPTTTKS